MIKNRFTLIELTVILTVLGILTSLLISVLSATKTKAKETECRVKIKYLSEAIIEYTSDHAGDMPEGSAGNSVSTGRFFLFDMAPYLGFKDHVYPNTSTSTTIWYKKACKGLEETGRYPIPDVFKCGFRQDDGFISYGWNHWYLNGGPATNSTGDEWKRIKYGWIRTYRDREAKVVKDTALQMVLGDSSNSQQRDSYKAGRYKSGLHQVSERHVGKDNEVGGNYLFMDHHVEWKSKSFLASNESQFKFWTVYK